MDPPYWRTTVYGVDFFLENYERMADFIRSCKGKVIVSLNDHPDILAAFEEFQVDEVDFATAYLTGEKRRLQPVKDWLF